MLWFARIFTTTLTGACTGAAIDTGEGLFATVAVITFLAALDLIIHGEKAFER